MREHKELYSPVCVSECVCVCVFMCLVLASELSSLGPSHLPTTLFDFGLKRVHSSVYLLINLFIQ